MSIVTLGTEDNANSRMPSPSIWKDCPTDVYDKAQMGRRYFNDFHQAVVGGATLVLGQPGGLTAYMESDAAGDLAIKASDKGELQIIGDGSDQDVLAVTSGDNVGGVWLTPKAGSPHRLWFEARVKVNSITDGDIGMFVGLAQPGEAKDAGGAFGGDAAALADVDYVGFAVLEGDGDALTWVYNEATSGTAQTGTAATLVADTYVKVGFKVEWNDNGAARVMPYVDGVALGDSVDVAIGLANANWPGNTAMDLLISHVVGTNGADSDVVTVDWVQIAQEYLAD